MYRKIKTKKKPYWELPRPRPLDQVRHTMKFVTRRIRQEDFHFWNADKYDCYIVGSDQVWRDWTRKNYNLKYYFLNFVKKTSAKRIAYAASFGKDTLEGAGLTGKVDVLKQFVEKFDAIGVREDSGIRLVKEAWGRETRQVIDPTLLLHAGDYSRLIDDPVTPLTAVIKPIFYYVLDLDAAKRKVIEQVACQRKQEYDGITTYHIDTLSPVEQWLKGFRDAEFVITDSFHGTIFSIINHTPFITFTNAFRGITRITSLLATLGLTDRIVDETRLEQFDYENYGEINWSEVESKLNALRLESGEWLLAQLKADKRAE